MIFSIRVILRKEKMGKQADESELIKSNNLKVQDNLVFTIDKNERITKFNEECEKVFGYKKNEVINRVVSDFFIPTRFLNQWENFLKYSKINKLFDNFKIPFLTKSGQEIIVYWNNFPIKNDKGDISDIGFVGNLITPLGAPDKTLFEYPKSESNKLNIKTTGTKEKNKVDDYINKVFRKMKRNNEDLLNKNKELENKLKHYENRLEYYKKREDEFRKKDSNLNKSLSSISEIFSSKKKRQEFENIVHDLDEREKDLNKLESNLLNEKIIINEKMNELKLWREKLELLNNKLEERWNDLVNRENLAIKYPFYSNTPDNVVETKSEELKNDYEIFDKIQDSAVILQRGILKHVNNSFCNLMGYEINEIIDKSFFDFIVPEYFLNVEKFYLNRLKGEDVSSYETVILTKNNNKISIEVDTKPTFFNGQKAEIAIVKILKNDYKK